jgi:hypothetical protein
MPSSIMKGLIAALVVIGVAALLVGVATTMVLLGLADQAPARAPRLASTETSFSAETDFWLRDYQQLRRPFVGEPRARPR